MTFGERVRRLREQNHWTRQELGERAGISPRVLGYYENDQRLTSALAAITKLSRVLKTTPDYLILGTPPQKARVSKPYRITENSALWVSDATAAFKKEAYTEEELRVLDYARQSGISASKLMKAAEFINALQTL